MNLKTIAYQYFIVAQLVEVAIAGNGSVILYPV